MGKLVQTTEMKVKDLLNKLIFNEKTPLSIFYVDKETNEEKEIFVNKENIMQCIENNEFELNDNLKYWSIEDIEDTKENYIKYWTDLSGLGRW